MEKLKSFKILFSFVVLSVASLFLTQTSLAQISLFAPFVSQPIPFKTEQSFISHTVVNQIAFSEVSEIASKQMWVGNKDLVFHVEARESLKSVQSPLFQFSKSSRDLIKKMAYRFLLQVILSDEKSAPLQQDMTGTYQINKSA